MITSIPVEKLQSIGLFNRFSNAEIEELLAVSDELHFSSGETIIEAGLEQRALYILLAGSVEIDLEVPKLGERVLAELTPGSIFGEMSLFHATPHAATVRCTADAQVIRLMGHQYDTLVSQGRAAALRLGANAAGILAARLQHTDQWIAEILTHQRERELRENWRKLREGMMTSFGPPKPFISVGGTLQ